MGFRDPSRPHLLQEVLPDCSVSQLSPLPLPEGLGATRKVSIWDAGSPVKMGFEMENEYDQYEDGLTTPQEVLAVSTMHYLK